LNSDPAIKALETYSYIVGYHPATTENKQCPMTTTSIDTGLNSYIVNDTTTNYQNSTGINMYMIYPKKKYYQLTGVTNNTGTYAQIGFYNSMNYNDNNFGKLSPRTWYFGNSATGFSFTVSYEAVDGNGNIVTGTATATNNAFSTGISNIISFNKITITSSTQTGVIGRAPITGFVYFTFGALNTNGSMTGVAGGYAGTSLFTCPNGYIASVQAVNGTFSATDYPKLLLWNESSLRSDFYSWQGVTSIAPTPYTTDSGVGGVFYPGQTLGLGATSTSGARIMYATICLQAY